MEQRHFTSLTYAPTKFSQSTRITWKTEEPVVKSKVKWIIRFMKLLWFYETLNSTDVGTKPEKIVIIGTDNGCAIFFRYEGKLLRPDLKLKQLGKIYVRIIKHNFTIHRSPRSLSMGHKLTVSDKQFQSCVPKRLLPTCHTCHCWLQTFTYARSWKQFPRYVWLNFNAMIFKCSKKVIFIDDDINSFIFHRFYSKQNGMWSSSTGVSHARLLVKI